MQKEASVLIIIFVASQHGVNIVTKDFINMQISTFGLKNAWKTQTNLSPPMFSSPVKKEWEVFDAVRYSHDSTWFCQKTQPFAWIENFDHSN